MLSFPLVVKNCEFPTYSSHSTTIEQRGFAENTPRLFPIHEVQYNSISTRL